MTENSIRATWHRIPAPPPGSEAAAVRVPGTNAWVIKTPRGGFGLVLTAVDRPPRLPPLKNLSLVYKQELQFEERGSTRRVARCLELKLEPPFDAEILASILDRLSERDSSGQFTSQLLVEVLEDVRAILAPADSPPKKDAVLGAWGELLVLEQLLDRSRDSAARLRVVQGWEAQAPDRDIIDFRLPNAGVALEVKSTLGERIHRFRGYGQLDLPGGFRKGFVASIRVEDSDAGRGQTCSDLANAVRKRLAGSDMVLRAFEERLAVKGAAALDSRYAFHWTPESIELYPMSVVPRPAPAPSVADVEWTADCSDCSPLAPEARESVLREASA